MKHDLYRAACANETHDVHIAQLTDVSISMPKNVSIRPDVVELYKEKGKLTFKTDQTIEGLVSPHYEYFLIREDGERLDFQVSNIGPAVKIINGAYEVKFF